VRPQRKRKSKGLVAEWGKGDGDVIRVELSKYQGHDMIALRIWRPNPNGSDQPLKNGLNLRVSHLPKLVRAMKSAHEKAKTMGLLEE
jgi:hypothetical protein